MLFNPKLTNNYTMSPFQTQTHINPKFQNLEQ
jgi:hypothetical protein